MSEDSHALDWNLLLVATGIDCPERTLEFLSGAIGACGGWVLTRHAGGDTCAELDFEFPRRACVEMYTVLVACGLTLSREAHLQLTELCHCTTYLLHEKGDEIVRLHLTAYTGLCENLAGLATGEAAQEAA